MTDNFFVLDIDEKFTKIVDAKKTTDGLEVLALGKIETTESFYSGNLEKNIDNQVIQIKKLIGALKITKKNVNVIIPDSLTYSQIISMPLLNEKELITAIKYQADQFIPMPIEETNIDIEVINEDQKEKKVLLLIVAAPKKIIARVQTTLELAGLNPESVENELSSTGRLINNFKINPSQGLVIANFDLNSTSLSYFSPNDLIIKEVHHLSIGYQLFLKETQVNTDTDIKKAEAILRTFSKAIPSSYPIDKIVQPLVTEFTNELNLFINKYNPAAIFFTNKIFLFPSLITSLSENLKIPINVFPTTSLVKKTQLVGSYKDEMSLFVSALGGSLRQY